MVTTATLTIVLMLSLGRISIAQHDDHHKEHAKPQGEAMHHQKMGMRAMDALSKLSGRAFNVAFLSQMTEHHRGAITMAKQALKVAKQPATRAEAQKVITAQTKEIGQFTGWLRSWYRTGPDQRQVNLVKADMKPMMQMKVTNDLMFYEMMIPHHQQAVRMAQLAVKKSDRAEIKSAARKIIADQTKEIAKYQRQFRHP